MTTAATAVIALTTIATIAIFVCWLAILKCSASLAEFRLSESSRNQASTSSLFTESGAEPWSPSTTSISTASAPLSSSEASLSLSTDQPPVATTPFTAPIDDMETLLYWLMTQGKAATAAGNDELSKSVADQGIEIYKAVKTMRGVEALFYKPKTGVAVAH